MHIINKRSLTKQSFVFLILLLFIPQCISKLSPPSSRRHLGRQKKCYQQECKIAIIRWQRCLQFWIQTVTCTWIGCRSESLELPLWHQADFLFISFFNILWTWISLQNRIIKFLVFKNWIWASVIFASAFKFPVAAIFDFMSSKVAAEAYHLGGMLLVAAIATKQKLFCVWQLRNGFGAREILKHKNGDPHIQAFRKLQTKHWAVLLFSPPISCQFHEGRSRVFSKI